MEPSDRSGIRDDARYDVCNRLSELESATANISSGVIQVAALELGWPHSANRSGTA